MAWASPGSTPRSTRRSRGRADTDSHRRGSRGCSASSPRWSLPPRPCLSGTWAAASRGRQTWRR
eukprot:6447332-Prymnesium_polylepis.1